MADGAALTIDGMAAMVAELRTLPAVMQTRLVKGAVATGASVIRKEAILRAPEWTGPVSQGHPPPGTLKKAIYQTRLSDECTPTIEAWKVDVRKGDSAQAMKSGKSTVNRDAFYAGWVEYGHFTRTPKGPGARGGRQKEGIAAGTVHWVAARPFMRPAIDNKSGEAFKAMQDYFNENLPAATLALQYIKAQGI